MHFSRLGVCFNFEATQVTVNRRLNTIAFIYSYETAVWSSNNGFYSVWSSKKVKIFCGPFFICPIRLLVEKLLENFFFVSLNALMLFFFWELHWFRFDYFYSFIKDRSRKISIRRMYTGACNKRSLIGFYFALPNFSTIECLFFIKKKRRIEVTESYTERFAYLFEF